MLLCEKIQAFEGPASRGDGARARFVSSIVVEPAADGHEDADDWYRRQHLDMLSMVPGVPADDAVAAGVDRGRGRAGGAGDGGDGGDVPGAARVGGAAGAGAAGDHDGHGVEPEGPRGPEVRRQAVLGACAGRGGRREEALGGAALGGGGWEGGH